MKIILYSLFFSLILYGNYDSEPKKTSGKLPDNEKFRSVKNNAFRVGEKTRYLVHYGPIDAGYANIEIKKVEKEINGRELWRIVGSGKSNGITDVFFHVEDYYESYIDKDGVFPWLFLRNVNEGGYEIQQTYRFYQNRNIVETEKGKKMEVPHGIQDMLSAAYYARTLDLSNIQKGDTIVVTSFVDGELFNLMIKYVGKDVANLRMGKFKCMKFNPVIQKGRIFKSEEDLEVWISDDENKLPILCSAKILVGSIKVELVEFDGLAHPLAVAYR